MAIAIEAGRVDATIVVQSGRPESNVKRKILVAVAVALQGVSTLPVLAQQTPTQTARPSTLDMAGIRRQAAELTDVRAALADPDPNIRLLTIREIARTGDAVQRQLAIETGLSSAESALQEVAIRAMMVNVHQIVFAITDADGKPLTQGESSFILSMKTFDPDTGKAEGQYWSGQFQGSVFNFLFDNGARRIGRLVWSPELGEFTGVINFDHGTVAGDRRASWRPR